MAFLFAGHGGIAGTVRYRLYRKLRFPAQLKMKIKTLSSRVRCKRFSALWHFLVHGGVIQGTDHILHNLLAVRIAGAFFSYLASPVHDDDAVRYRKYVGQCVADEDDWHSFFAKFANQIEHLPLVWPPA